MTNDDDSDSDDDSETMTLTMTLTLALIDVECECECECGVDQWSSLLQYLHSIVSTRRVLRARPARLRERQEGVADLRCDLQYCNCTDEHSKYRLSYRRVREAQTPQRRNSAVGTDSLGQSETLVPAAGSPAGAGRPQNQQ